MRTVAIVGAGTAGCVVARRLADAFRDSSESPRIVLIEQGRPNSHHDDADFMLSLTEKSPVVTRVNATITQRVTREPYSYMQGRCVGGGGAVNGMVVSPLYVDDFHTWRDKYGCSDWSPEKVVTNANDLFPTTALSGHEVGDIGRALIVAGAEPAHLLWNGVRVSGASVIADVVTEGTVEIIQANAAQLIIDDNAVRGVATDDGVVNADTVVIAAGAIASPLLLQQSGITSPYLGQRAQDHPSVFFTVTRSTAFVGGLNASAVRSMGDTQIIGYESANPATPMFGGVSLSVLKVESRGHVAGTLESPHIDLNLLSSQQDLELMRRAVRQFVEETVPVLEEHCGSVLCDDQGTSARELGGFTDAVLDAWLFTNVVPHSHISGTCAMGDNPYAVVSQRGQVPTVLGLYVADASVFPQLPRSNTNMVVATVASHIAGFIVEDLS